MSLVNVDELLAKAEAGNYAVGAFNCNNMEIVTRKDVEHIN